MGSFHETGDYTRDYPFTELGITALLSLTPMFFAGVEANVMWVPNYQGSTVPSCLGGETTCFTLVDENLHATFGVRF